EAELRRRAAFLRGELFERVDELLVLLRVAALEARHAAASVILRQVSSRNRAREKAAAERRVGEEADAELVGERENLRLDVAGPQRILGLHCGHWVHLVGAAGGG